MTAHDHDLLNSRLSDYVFGWVSADERRTIEEHVRGCAECQRELAELELVMQRLAQVPEPVTPPAALKGKVLDRLARERQGTTRTAVVTPIARPKPVWRTAWLAAAAALILVLAGALAVSIARQRETAALLAQRSGDIDEMRDRLASYASQTDVALSILTASDMRRIELANKPGSPIGAGRAYWSPTRGLLIAADRLPTPPPGRIYQVWIISGTSPISAGLLGNPAGGRGMLIVQPPTGAGTGPVTIAVTDEPPGGLPAPSGNMHLVGAL